VALLRIDDLYVDSFDIDDGRLSRPSVGISWST
jgi:hypothetical protein